MVPSQSKYDDPILTEKHDLIQNWIDSERRYFIKQIEHVLRQQLFQFLWINDRTTEPLLDTERNLHSGTYTVGRVDGVFDIHDSMHCDKCGENDMYRRVVYEVKPRLYNVGGTIGQLDEYAFRLRYFQYNDHISSKYLQWPYKVVITLDENQYWDNWFRHKQIAILRISLPMESY